MTEYTKEEVQQLYDYFKDFDTLSAKDEAIKILSFMLLERWGE